MCVCVCACVCVCVRACARVHVRVFVRMFVRARACACVCVCAFACVRVCESAFMAAARHCAIAAHCSRLRCVALHCTTLHSVSNAAPHCAALQACFASDLLSQCVCTHLVHHDRGVDADLQDIAAGGRVGFEVGAGAAAAPAAAAPAAVTAAATAAAAAAATVVVVDPTVQRIGQELVGLVVACCLIESMSIRRC